jgi:uncharacterized protein (TIGR02996 family)
VASDPRLEAFVRAVVAAPGDETLRMVLADYLEERGNPLAYKLRDPGYWSAGSGLTWYRTSGEDYPSGGSLYLSAPGVAMPRCPGTGTLTAEWHPGWLWWLCLHCRARAVLKPP